MTTREQAAATATTKATARTEADPYGMTNERARAANFVVA
jgi:hypothetical protein